MVKNQPAMQETQVQSLNQEDPLKKEWQPTPVFLPGKSHGQRSLEGYSPWGCQRVGHDLATKPPPPPSSLSVIFMVRKPRPRVVTSLAQSHTVE